MDFLSVFITHNTILSGLLLLGLGAWVYFDDRDSPRHVTLAGMLTGSALWTFAHILWRAAERPEQQLFWMRTVFFIGAVLPVFFMFYAIAVMKARMPRVWVQATAFATLVLVMPLVYASDLVVRIAPGGAYAYGDGRTVIAMYFGIFFLLGLGALLRVPETITDADRSRRLFAGLGAIIAFNPIFAVMSGATAGFEDASYWVGNLALVVGMLVFMLTSVRRRLLIDIRLLGAELFILLTVSVIVVDLLVAESLLDFTLRLALLMVLVLYGILLTRSLVREARRLREIEHLNAQVMNSNRELAESDRMKVRFVSFASHQMRAPLTGVKGYLSMLRDGDFGGLTSEQRDVVALNLRALERLSETVDTFLDVSKVELDGMKLDRRDVTVRELVSSVVEHMRPAVMTKGIGFRIRFDGSGETLHVDSGRLYHAMANLIDNAVKYTAHGTITVSTEVKGGRFEFRVDDTGSGLGPDDIEEVRSVLRDGFSSLRFDERGGSGLGLHIVKRIVEAHGGTVTVDSAGKGKGSTFGFRVPVG